MTTAQTKSIVIIVAAILAASLVCYLKYPLDFFPPKSNNSTRLFNSSNKNDGDDDNHCNIGNCLTCRADQTCTSCSNGKVD